MSTTDTDIESGMYTFEPSLPPEPAKRSGGRGLDSRQHALALRIREDRGWVKFIQSDKKANVAMKASRVRKGHDKSWSAVGKFEAVVREVEGGWAAWARWINPDQQHVDSTGASVSTD